MLAGVQLSLFISGSSVVPAASEIDGDGRERGRGPLPGLQLDTAPQGSDSVTDVTEEVLSFIMLLLRSLSFARHNA